eukprot:CAMPEP_0119022768 /NCGR_PEP_ID=MMETSP1176-20130426/28721_1 /TAXON_ID=265551 /ORGANISM="Synedropsis recta cf, Strain CCMP1620" /LENGTH=50 /DNA_ID=CAMNT_0006977705 /DNA_START=16 /DNA_END=164 /DNA_ORIENTATION=+
MAAAATATTTAAALKLEEDADLSVEVTHEDFQKYYDQASKSLKRFRLRNL